MSDSRVKNSAHNMVTGFMYHGLTLILSFVSRTVFIQTLGREYLGLNGVFSDVLTLLSMADLGFNTAMAYSFYKPLADNDQKTITSLVAFYKKVYNFIALAVAVLGLLCVPFLKYIINTETEIPNLEIYYLCSLAGIVISYLFVYKTTILTADQKNYMVVWVSIWTSIIKTVLQIASLLILKNYIVYLVIGIVILFINNFVASKQAEKTYPYIMNKANVGKVDKELTDGIWKNMKSVFIYKFSGTMFSATDNIIISIVVGTAMVGIYSNYLMISSKLLLIIQIIFSSLTASIGNIIAKESAKKKYEVFTAMQSASYIMCGVITSAFCLLSNDLMEVWLGSDFKVSTLTIIAITLNTYFSCVLLPLWIYRDATGLYIKTKYVALAGAILNIGLSFLLGHFLGIAGIILATSISRVCTYFWYEPKVLFKDYFEHSAVKYYFQLFFNLILVAVTITGLGFLTSKLEVHSWPTLILKGFIIGVVCCIVFVLAYCRTEGFKIISNRILSIFKKKENNIV